LGSAYGGVTLQSLKAISQFVLDERLDLAKPETKLCEDRTWEILKTRVKNLQSDPGFNV
jgi:hypothetical protein